MLSCYICFVYPFAAQSDSLALLVVLTIIDYYLKEYVSIDELNHSDHNIVGSQDGRWMFLYKHYLLIHNA